MVSTLAQLVDAAQKPLFSVRFLAQKYLHFTPDELELNKKYLEQETLEQIEKAKLIKQHAEYNATHAQGEVPQTGEEGGGAPDFGGLDFGGGGGGADFGGGGGADFGGGGAEPEADMGGGGEDFA